MPTPQTLPESLATTSPAAQRRPGVHDLQALLYREIGISAVAAVLTVTNEARASDQHREQAHPLPAILQEHDLAA